jgi:hypothetical protein
MAVTHTNRRGKTFYLHQGKTPKGNPKYHFAQSAEGDLVETIPDGYEVYENPNGRVYLRRIPPQIITDEEVAAVDAGIPRYSRLERYIIDVRKNAILIYTPDQDVDLLLASLSQIVGIVPDGAETTLESILTYSPMLQFVLVDKTKRLFEPQRVSFLGPVDEWVSIGDAEVLPKLVKTYVKHLGEDSFYDLY